MLIHHTGINQIMKKLITHQISSLSILACMTNHHSLKVVSCLKLKKLLFPVFPLSFSQCLCASVVNPLFVFNQEPKKSSLSFSCFLLSASVVNPIFIFVFPAQPASSMTVSRTTSSMVVTPSKINFKPASRRVVIPWPRAKLRISSTLAFDETKSRMSSVTSSIS